MLIAAIICICISAAFGVLYIALSKPAPEKVEEPAPKEPVRHGSEWVLGASSIIGSRQSQQDSFMLPGPDVSDFTRRVAGELMVLCDGMGGMSGGERASRICVDTLYKSFYTGMFVKEPSTFFSSALSQADRLVAGLTDTEGNPLRSGTTCVAAIVRGNKLYWASVGDSRIYMYSAGRLRQVTRDHNYSLTLAKRVAAGEISAEQAESDPQRDALISYIGKGRIEILDLGTERMSHAHGDAVILSSDGLYRALSEEEITAVIQENRENPEHVPEALTDESSSKTWMRHDNTTVIVAM